MQLFSFIIVFLYHLYTNFKFKYNKLIILLGTYILLKQKCTFKIVIFFAFSHSSEVGAFRQPRCENRREFGFGFWLGSLSHIESKLKTIERP